ncbi:pyrimidine-specific ribonucleoside hydrolase rihB [Trifolium pratense]|uniref:Pyrimidine-specific ribonucleoside hydrolase rihB n=1 Tax=Trifolium pratense TaxID=57577 RepID=A0A2K3NVU8_TRIPR|nr:pyrimidine-specific ribonucleoside hydrolase rihB [Trifolium pratense]
MLLQRLAATVLFFIIGFSAVIAEGNPHRIVLDTDVDTDDFFALFYLLKQNTSQFQLEGVTINANSWSDAGHAVNHIYDLLYMMGRDDIAVGVGGDGGILPNGTILPNVGGYLPIIEQELTTAGSCRYRQAIPVGSGGRLDKDSNYGIRKAFLPQGKRKYTPLEQPTAQQVLIEKVSAGPTTLFVIGANTNVAIFLMNNPHLKKNVEHIYIMGGGVRSSNPASCCPNNSSSSCVPPGQCGIRGNLFTDYNTNPYAEFNFFLDPFAAYQVIHSGVPVTLVPLDATNTIPITEQFIDAFEKRQDTYEAQYCFKSLKNNFLWDPFMTGVAISIMSKPNNYNGENEFAEMEYMNITVITSNKPYGIYDGSNPLFDGLRVPKFNLQKGGVHSGHVQQGLRDPLCFVENGTGKCQDGYTKEVDGPDSVRVLVATKAKPNRDVASSLDKEFYISFLNVLNQPQQAGKFNFTTQFPYYKEVTYKPDFHNKSLGKPVVFDMDMSAGDFLALFYLLKVPVEVIDLKAIIVSPTGWANAATIDIIYDILHMMGRDDIPVGLGDVFATNQTDPIFSSVGGCKYVKAIPHGSGGYIDSDTLYGLARNLPRSPRRYTAENPELRQPLAMEVWESVLQTLKPGSNVTVLTNGPLTSLAKVVSMKNISSRIQEVYVVGGHISINEKDRGNVFSVPSNQYAEFNMFLDPLAATTVFESQVNITLIPLSTQRLVSSFPTVIGTLRATRKTPEVLFSERLLSTLYRLKQINNRYHHMDTFLGEILGAVVLADKSLTLKPKFEVKPIKVLASGDESSDGKIVVDEKHGKLVRILSNVEENAYYNLYANKLGDQNQSAKIGSFEEQTRNWSHPHDDKLIKKKVLHPMVKHGHGKGLHAVTELMQ